MSRPRPTGVLVWLATLYERLSRALPAQFRTRFGRELLDDYRDMLIDAQSRGGLPLVLLRGALGLIDLAVRIPRERRAARRRSSQPTLSARVTDSMGTFLQDLRVAVRSLAKHPAFSFTAVITLALGMASALAIFTLVNAILLRPLPYPQSERIVEVRHHAPGLDLPNLNNSDGTVRFYHENATSLFEAFAALDVRARNALLGETPERTPILYATPEIFDVLRVRPTLGRAFNEADAAQGAAPVALLTYGTWTRNFGRDPSVIGRTVEVEDVATEIVGVMPEGFDYETEDLALVAPLGIDPQGSFGTFGLDGIARLRDGVTLADARTQLEELQARFPTYFVEEEMDASFLASAGWAVSARTLRDARIAGAQTALWVVSGSVLFLLLVACANVANLFMVRAEGARKPTAVRAALGASRWRIAWGVLAETLTLTAVGTAVGAALAWGALAWVRSANVADLPRMNEVHMDGTTVLVAVGLSLVVGVLLALLPVVRLRTTVVADDLRRDGRTSTGGRDATWSRDLLVAVQLAAALVLVVGSGLLFRSFARLQAVDPGFDPENVIIAGLSRSTNEDPAAALASHRLLMERLAGLPGIDQVALTSGMPFIEGNANGGSFDIESRPRADDALPPVAMNKSVSPGYFETLRMPVLQGRTMQRGDGEDGRPVVWVNKAFADRFLDGAAVGERIRDNDDGEWAEIVGVVGDVREFGLNAEVRPMMYVPAALFDWGPHLGVARVVLLIKGQSSARDVGDALRRTMAELDPRVPVLRVRPLVDGMAESMAQRRYTMIIVLLAGVVALLLGAIGLFGVISYVVSQRRREIGLRIALGAEAHDVERLFVNKGAKVTALGVVGGLVGAVLLSRVLRSALFEISATDPVTFVVAPILLSLVALLASWLPARRAARLDPMETLRAE